MPGELTYKYINEYVDDIVTVTEDEIATAVLMLMEKQKLVCEGAGALSVAAVISKKVNIDGKNTCCILSGGNIDVNILSRVINRGLLNSGRTSDLYISLTDKPGQLEGVSRVIARNGGNVIGVFYDQGEENSDINSCVLKIKMETRNFNQIQDIKDDLNKSGFCVLNKVI
jgi:threonine dehydratase